MLNSLCTTLLPYFYHFNLQHPSLFKGKFESLVFVAYALFAVTVSYLFTLIYSALCDAGFTDRDHGDNNDS